MVPVLPVLSPSPEQLLNLSPAVLRALVATFGPIPGLELDAPPLAIAKAIFEGRSPVKLARVLTTVLARFLSEAGRSAIVEAGMAKRDPRVAAWLEVPAGDVAATLAIEAATTKGKSRRDAEWLLALAGARLGRELAARQTYELLGATPLTVEGITRALGKAFGPLLYASWTHADADGSFHVAVFLRAPAATCLALERDKLVPRVDAPIAVDLVRVDPGRTRVSFTLARPDLLPSYANALELSLRPSFTLKPTHDLTPARLARIALPRGVRSVTFVARRWRRPDGSRHEVRAFDALDPAHEGSAPQTGYVDRVTLRVQIGERSIDAFLQLPHRLEISDRAFESEVREVLAAIGLFEPGALPDDAKSLAPHVHGDWRWRRVVGDQGFETMVARKLLVKALAAHVVTKEHRMHGAGYVVREVVGPAPRGGTKGVEYALAEDRSLGAQIVGKAERAAWRLDSDALAAGMRKELGSVAVGRPGAIAIDGVIDLGVVALASGKLRFVYAIGAPAKGWMGSLVRACGIGVTPVVLVPKGHGAEVEAGLVIELDVDEQLGVKSVGRVLAKAAEALGVEGEIEPWRRHEEEIVIDAAAQRVWVLGVPVSLNERPFRFLECLAKNAGHVTATKDLGTYVSTGGAPDVTARKMKRVLEEQVRKALEGARTESEVVAEIVGKLVVVEGRKGYRIGVPAKVI